MGKEKQSKIIRNNSIVTEITDEERDSPGLSGIVIFLQTLSDEMKDSQELTGTNLLRQMILGFILYLQMITDKQRDSPELSRITFYLTENDMYSSQQSNIRNYS